MKMHYLMIFIIVLAGIFVLVDKFLYGHNIQQVSNISDQITITKPDNFVQITRDIQRGIFYDYNNLSKNYYLQPDFYPSYKLESMASHDYSRWGVHGYGAYPGEISFSIKNFSKGQYINVYTFIKAGDDIETFQGMKFIADLVNGNKSDFDTIIDPDTVMFNPTFPIREEYTIENRTYDWAYKMKITIVANKDIPPGSYEFKLKALPPDDDVQKLYYSDMQEIDQKWYTCANDKKGCDEKVVELRKKVYVNGGQIQADKFFNVIINVG